MADIKISAMTPGAALAGTEQFEMVQSAGTFSTTVSAIYTYVRSLFPDPGAGAFLRNASSWMRTFISPGYVSGNWYPADYGLSVQAGSSALLNTIYFSPLVIYQDVTITDLAAEVTTLIAASNFQLAVYAADATTKRPIGAPLATTGNISGATVQAVGATVGTPVSLPAGMYWLGFNTDTSGIVFRSIAAAQAWITNYTGSATLSQVLRGSPGMISYILNQTFGTWPTVVTVTEVNNPASNRVYVGAYKAQ